MITEEQEVLEQEQVQEEENGADLLGTFIGGESKTEEGEKKEVAEEKKPEPVELPEEIKTEMSDYQDLLNKGYDNLSEEEKAKFDDYKERYKVEEVKEEKVKEQEAWKSYNEEALLKKIDEGDIDDITDDHIEFLRSKGHELEVEEPDPKQETKEEVKDQLPEYVDDLKALDFFKGREFKTSQEAVEGLREYIGENERINKSLTDIFSKTPEFARVIQDIAQGKTPDESVRKHFADLFNEEAPKPGDDGYEEYVMNKIKRREALEKENEKQAEIAQNLQKSIQNTQSFVTKKKLNEAQAKEFLTNLDGFVGQLANKVISEDLMDLVYKGLNFDKSMAEAQKTLEKEKQLAEQRGEIKGRNISIVSKKATPKGDGIRRVKRNVQSTIKNNVEYADDSAEILDKFLGGGK